MTVFKDLTEFPLFCIYALIDETSGYIYIQYSNGNALNHLTETITLLKRNIHDYRVLQHSFNHNLLSLRVIETFDGPIDDILARVKCTLYVQNSGLNDCTGYYNTIQYKVYKRVMDNYSNFYSNQPLVYVTAKSRSVEAIVLGIFDTMMEADEFIETCHPGLVMRELKFAGNKHTREYHTVKGYKLIRFREKV